MKRIRNPDELSPQQLNEQLLNQQKYLEQTLESQAYLIDELQNYLQSLQLLLGQQSKQLEQLDWKNKKTQKQLEQLGILIEKQRRQQEQLQHEHRQQIEKKQSTLAVARQNQNKLKSKENNLVKQLCFLDEQIMQLNNHTRLLENKVDTLNNQNKKYQAQINRTRLDIRHIQDFIQDCYMNKKKFNNQLQELRGNIRVYCRIRPFLPSQYDQPIYELINQNTLKLKVPKQNHKSENHQKDYIFNFEQIFDMKQNQQNVFNELAQLIQSAVDGKNVCIFAYGQTGSGKTYTMQGGDSFQSKGIIPRSIQLIFSEAERAQKYQWQSQISVTIQQVYLEGVRDLLNPKVVSNPEENIRNLVVSKPQHIYSMLEEAGKNRKVAETSCNEHSSRSHLIFTIHILSKNNEKNLERRGSLNLVDLAGSERVALSKVQGDRMKQTQAINKSLTNLGIVISALAKKQQHIPFRNSKLTFLLQKYLQGDSKTLMFVNISPKQSDFNQTICSLRFAQKVKECKLKK